MMSKRTYELIDWNPGSPNIYGVAIYRERVDPPPPRPQELTAQALARAMFHLDHVAEALEIADHNQADVHRVLKIMREKTKRRAFEDLLIEAIAILDLARRSP